MLTATSTAELQKLINCLELETSRYTMLINAYKTNVMISNREKLTIRGNGQILGQVDSFLYMGAIIAL